MNLLEQIDLRRREIHTDGYSMSIGEVISMYRDGELDIHPEFQRIFRWTEEQKSRLIESILLGIPIPTIFVSQREDGIWDVIDGVQRLSTILEFVGHYRDENNRLVDPLVLLKTEYLPTLDGYCYEDRKGYKSFNDALRRDFKRSKLSFVIVKKESDPEAKFDLFQRLNSGTELSAQEARNCLLVMLDRTFYEWIIDLSHDESFNATVGLTQRKEDEGFRQELVLRFLLHATYSGTTKELGMEFGEYLTHWVRSAVAEGSIDREEHGSSFRQAFSLLNRVAEDNTFRRWDSTKGRFLGSFSISAFEAITSGVSKNMAYWNDRPAVELQDRIREMWTNAQFRQNSGTGITARRRMPRLVTFGRTHFARR